MEIFNFKFKRKNIRSFKDEKGEPWFVAKDVCDVLELTTFNVTRDLDNEEIRKVKINLSTGKGSPNRIIINESGLYSLILKSRKPQAVEFKKWVTSEVLPSIRKNGGYISGQEFEDDPQVILARALKLADSIIKDMELRLQEMKPKAELHDKFILSKSESTMTQVAKTLGMTAVELGRLLRRDGILFKRTDQVIPTKMAIDNEWMVCKNYYNHCTQEAIIQGYFTPKGEREVQMRYEDE
jgi:anti-repressor protein